MDRGINKREKAQIRTRKIGRISLRNVDFRVE